MDYEFGFSIFLIVIFSLFEKSFNIIEKPKIDPSDQYT